MEDRVSPAWRCEPSCQTPQAPRRELRLPQFRPVSCISCARVCSTGARSASSEHIALVIRKLCSDGSCLLEICPIFAWSARAGRLRTPEGQLGEHSEPSCQSSTETDPNQPSSSLQQQHLRGQPCLWTTRELCCTAEQG